ncbi:MAG: FGGY family carbohydrate kinase [Bacteriovoracaceae bacterium]
MGFILSIDQGTTGTTAVLIDSSSFELVDKLNQEFPQIFPTPGWVEHDLNDIWGTVENTVLEILKKNNLNGTDIDCIGITNQRETTCAFDNNGSPLANAIVWQDRRTSEFCKHLRENDLSEKVKDKTGLPLDPYFSATKMYWLLQNDINIQKAKDENNLKFGTIDTYLLYKLTGEYKTEPSNASRTLLMDLESCQWDKELLEIFEIPSETLPQINQSFSLFGKTKNLKFLPDGIPVSGILGDQQAALFGQAGIEKGDMKCTYGTGAFLLLNTGLEKQKSDSGLLTTVAYQTEKETFYALEGSCYIAGAAVQWLRDNLNIIESSPEVEKLAEEVTDLEQMRYLMFMPFFTGIGSPYWNAEAKGALLGLTRDTKRSHIARACLDGICLSINDLVDAFRKDTGLSIKNLKVDGGAVSNNLLMNIQSSVSQLEIIKPRIIETTAFGAALAAAIGSGICNIDKIKELWHKDKSFDQEKDLVEFYNTKKGTWKATIEKLFN